MPTSVRRYKGETVKNVKARMLYWLSICETNADAAADLKAAYTEGLIGKAKVEATLKAKSDPNMIMYKDDRNGAREMTLMYAAVLSALHAETAAGGRLQP